MYYAFCDAFVLLKGVCVLAQVVQMCVCVDRQLHSQGELKDEIRRKERERERDIVSIIVTSNITWGGVK